MAAITNDNTITFGPPTATWLDVTHAGIRFGGSGQAFYGRSALSNNPDPAQSGATVEFAAGDLDFSIPAGELTEAAVQAMATALVSSGLIVSLHSGNPGTTGANELSGSGYARVTVAAGDWTVS